MIRRFAGFALALLAFLGSGCPKDEPKPPPEAGGVMRVSIAGSSAMLPLVTDAANRYMRAHPDVAVEVAAGGSGQGIARVLRGEITIGTSDIFADPAAAEKLVDHKVALTGFAAMANRGKFNEAIESLTLDQLRGIFSGKVKDWSEVGGGHQPIVVINRGKGSGTRITFGQIVLGGDNFAPGQEQDSSGLVQSSLEQTPGSISYLALGYRRDSLKVFAVGGVAATNDNVANGTYPIWAYEHMYTLGPATGAARSFIDFMLSPEVERELLPKSGFTPVSAGRAASPPRTP